MKWLIQMAILFILCIVTAIGQQNEIPVLEYGDEVRATLPLQGLESEFQFEGEAGDIIIVEVSIKIDDILTGFYPSIELLNERGTAIARSIGENVQYTAILPFELQADGKYSILVTPGEYSFVQADAPFHVRLLQPQILEHDTAVEDVLLREVSVYYIVVASEPFEVEVIRKEHRLFPAVAVANMQAGGFDVLGLLLGQNLLEGSLTIDPTRNPIHFVELSKPTLEGTIIPVDEEVGFQLSISK